MSTKEVKEFDFDAIDVSLDDIEDLPSYDCPPNGSYQLLVNAQTKVFDGKDGKADTQAVIFEYEITDVVELADKTGTGPQPKPGDKFTEMFGLGSEDGIKWLKKAILPYSAHFGTNNLRELVQEKVQQLTITAVVKGRKAGPKADDPEKRYATVSNVVLS